MQAVWRVSRPHCARYLDGEWEPGAPEPSWGGASMLSKEGPGVGELPRSHQLVQGWQVCLAHFPWPWSCESRGEKYRIAQHLRG